MRHIIPFLLVALVAAQIEDPTRLAQRARDLVLQRHQQGEAENLVRKAISLWDEMADPKGPEYARALTLLGMLHEVQLMQNERELELQVQPLYEKAIDILERAPGASSADLALALELDANVLTLLKRADAAIQPFGRAKALRSRRIADMQEATSPVSTTPYRIGGRTGAPHLVSKVEPEYSEEARLLKYQGTVVVSVVVDVDGTAKDIRLVRNLGLGLDEKAVAAVQQWHFQPGMIGSQPVPVQATIEVNFRLL